MYIIIIDRSSSFEFYWNRWSCIPIFSISSDIKYLNGMNEYLIDLPNLNSLLISSYAFYNSSLEIRGIRDVMSIVNRSS